MFLPNKKEFYVIEYSELEDMIVDTWPQMKGYSIIEDNEWNNYASYEADSKFWDDDDDATLERLNNGENIENWSADAWLEALIQKGKLPRGSYLIHVFW